jgi:hypothetical protein
VHTVELLDWATGGPMPPMLEGKPLREQKRPDYSAETPDVATATPQDAGGPGFW